MSTSAHQPPCPSRHAASETRKLLSMLVVSVAVVGLIAIGVVLAVLRQAAMDDARTRVGGAARLLEDHVARTFRATHSILGRVNALARSQPMDALAADRQAWTELGALAQALPEPGTLWVIDSSGTVRLDSVAFPSTPNDVSDRHYFAAHRQPTRDMVVGPMVTTRFRGKQAFQVSRRIDGPGGAFLGVVAASFHADAFTDFQEPLPLGKNASINILDLDGRIIMRQPNPQEWAGRAIAGSPVMKAAATGATSGVLIGVSPLDQIERLVAWRLVPGSGVVVMAAEDMNEVLAPWRKAVWTAAGVVFLVAVLLGVLVRFTFASLAREEALVRGLEDTVRQRTEEAEARAEEARLANDSKTRFLATASHDLRQPLQAAGMFIEALSVRMAESPHANVVEKVRQSIDATNNLLTTLLDVSTLEAGKITPQVATFPLMTLMASLYDQVEPEASAKKLELRVVPTGARVTSDPVLLERILRNLMLNATRYTSEGGILLGCRQRGDGRLAICVVDTGSGIPADKLDIIFDDFTRLGDKGSGAQRGLGLGLGVVRRTAALLGHTIEVRSVEGKGSCFAVVVPAA